MQGTPAGLPKGMPGIGLEIDGAIQQAPQPARQVIDFSPSRGIAAITAFPAGFSVLLMPKSPPVTPAGAVKDT